MPKAASTSDYRELARRRIPHFLFEYIDGGAYGETTLARNVGDLTAVALRQRVLKDVSRLDLRTTLFGTEYAMPVGLAPVGLAGLTARRGETQAVRAAQRAGLPFCLSTVSACPLAEVAGAAAQPFWFQLYMVRDRAFMQDLIAEAKRVRCSALVFTVDLPVPGARYRDVRSALTGAPGVLGSARRAGQALLRPHWLWDVALRGRPLSLGNVAPVVSKDSGLKDFLAWIGANFDASLTWSDLDWIRAQWDGPIILKGVLDVEDAIQAASLGLDGIVVSNHGGRQLDGVWSTTRALPAIAQAVGERLTVLADGGVRSGLDVLRLLALGARGVLIGRPWVYGLAAAGEHGVTHVLSIIEAELKVAMALTGCTRIADVGPHLLSDTTS